MNSYNSKLRNGKEEQLIEVSLVLPSHIHKYLNVISNKDSMTMDEIFRQLIDKEINST